MELHVFVYMHEGYRYRYILHAYFDYSIQFVKVGIHLKNIMWKRNKFAILETMQFDSLFPTFSPKYQQNEEDQKLVLFNSYN